VDWAVTTPLMILNLGLLAGEDTVMIAAVMGADVGMIVAGYLGAVALVPTVKWLWFIIGLAVFAPVVIALVRTFRQTVIDKNDVDRIELYGKVSLLTIVVWSLYPIVWFLGVGTGAIGVSLEAISFAILDVISKCVFSFMIVQLNVSPKQQQQQQQQKPELPREQCSARAAQHASVLPVTQHGSADCASDRPGVRVCRACDTKGVRVGHALAWGAAAHYGPGEARVGGAWR
jgi:bacteriorhodopsin